MGNWRKPAECADALMGTFTAAFESRDSLQPDIFPDLRQDDRLVIAGDYSGEHQASGHRILTFLLADWTSVMGNWERRRLEIRATHLHDGRTFAFKKLKDGALQNAVLPFLAASAKLNGIVLTVAVDKALSTSTLGHEISNAEAVKPNVLAKMIQVGKFGSLLVGGLSRPGQRIAWVTDNDEIVANAAALEVAGNVIGAMVNRMCPTDVALDRCIISGQIEDQKRAEDLCAIPDLVGGAVADYLEALPTGTGPDSQLLTTPARRLSTKSTLILGWLGLLKAGLKNVNVIVRPAGLGQLSVSFFDLSVIIDPTGLHLPPDRGWEKALSKHLREGRGSV